ncbi:MAG: DUF4065 domain-containing protein [Candidatus Caenarcaniphilales bacterium]|nr:DUF4065 domain-containing protein [Candidatus Caenarcaniphilales bacterium]
MTYRALDVANSFIKLGIENNNLISNMKLQKLLYYAQGWHMALHFGKSLFREDFKKWLFGPVCPSVYGQFKKYGSNPIKRVADVKTKELDEKAQKLVEKVFELYGGFSAVQLSMLSHKEDPWLKAEDLGIIDKDSIHDYFSREKERIEEEAARRDAA